MHRDRTHTNTEKGRREEREGQTIINKGYTMPYPSINPSRSPKRVNRCIKKDTQTGAQIKADLQVI